MGKVITFEGIDGTGKTFWAKKLSEYFSDNSIYLDKKSLECSERKYIQEVGKNLGKVIWKAQENDPIELLSDRGWLFLHLAWLYIFQENVLLPLKNKYEIVFLDGWYYKILSRFMKKEMYDENFLISLFENLEKPQKSIFLDKDISTCYNQKTSFTKCELGRMDGIVGNEKESFIKYQSSIRHNYIRLIDAKIMSNVVYINDIDSDAIYSKCVEIVKQEL